MTSRFLAVGLMLAAPAFVRAEDAPIEQLTPYESALTDYKLGKNDSALVAINEAETAKPGDPTIEILKARILGESLRFDEAIKTLTGLNDSPQMTPTFRHEQTLALGDISLHKRDFNAAAKFYESLFTPPKTEPDLLLKAIYARIGLSDLVTAGKYFSQLKPLDTVNPSYYFAKAALAQAAGQSQQADDTLQSAQTLYGVTVTNRYLKVYLRFFNPEVKSPAAAGSAPAGKSAPTGAKP